MARALVLGATGHIGAHIVRALLDRGHEVRAAFHRERYLPLLSGLQVERVQVDLQEPQAVRRAAGGCQWVFHAAGYYPTFRERREEAVRTAIASVRRVMEEIRAAGCERVVFTSSAATIRARRDRASTEDDLEPWPLDGWRPLYATVKVAMEHEVLRACAGGVPVVVVNPTVCIGEYDAHAFSGRAVLIFAKGRMPFYLDRRINAIYTGDVGVGHLSAAERGRVGARYILTAHEVPLRAFAATVARLAGVPPPRIRLPNPVALAAASVLEVVARLTHTEPLLPRQAVHTSQVGKQLDGSKAVRELSLPQTPLEEAIRRALAWFRVNGRL